MRTLRELRNVWMPLVTAIVLGCCGVAVAQATYQVTDLGAEGSDNLGCAMSLNDEGWTEIMAGNVEPGQQQSISGRLLNGRALVDVDGNKLDLGTLGGQNTWMNWGEINNYGQVVGFSETDVPDPNGEDICGFGTHLTCRPFLWQSFGMSALPTLGGNNGLASAINNRGQVVGCAETPNEDSGCPPNRIQLPVLWERGTPQALPTAGSDPDGFAFWINDEGEAAGYTGTCTAALHAVWWRNGTVSMLPDLGAGAIALGINNGGQIVGTVGSADGTTQFGALWRSGVLTNLGTLPGDSAAIATGINNKGQVVGSTWDSNFDWAHAFLWQDGVMTDLNTLFPASSNLFAVMANKINESGQISGMAIVRSGPDAGNIHAFVATPVNGSMGPSVAEVVPMHPKITPAAKVGKQTLPRFVLNRSGR